MDGLRVNMLTRRKMLECIRVLLPLPRKYAQYILLFNPQNYCKNRLRPPCFCAAVFVGPFSTAIDRNIRRRHITSLASTGHEDDARSQRLRL